jgi:hypothetical protein
MGMSNESAARENQWWDEHPNLNATNAVLRTEGIPAISPPGPLPLPIFHTTGLDWYLFCIIVWRCLLPLLAQLRCSMSISVLLGIAIMFTDASSTVYSNAIFAFMPFFILGYQAKQMSGEIEKLRGSRLAKACFLLAGVAFLGSCAADTEMRAYMWISRNLGCLYGGGIRDQMNENIADTMTANITQMMLHPTPAPETHYCQTAPGVVQVLLFYALATAGVLGFLAVAPTQRTLLLTRAGANAIYIYFGQLWAIMFFSIIIFALGLGTGLIIPVGLAALCSFAAVLLVWALLAQPCFKCCCQPFIEPRVESGCLPIAER